VITIPFRKNGDEMAAKRGNWEAERNEGTKFYLSKSAKIEREDENCIYHWEIPEDRTMRNTKREPSERSAETRCDVVQVDLWVAMAKETEGGKEGEGGRWKRGASRGRETVFVSQVSHTVHGHGDRLWRPD